MDFGQKPGGIMDFPPKLWISPVAFAPKCTIMIKSFEAGNTKVFKVFPINFNSGGTVNESGIHFLWFL
jgi:hypothetical protein